MPIVAKTDFTLQQQMMGIGRCKDLDEWLVGSGESAETADSKKLAQSLQPSLAGFTADPYGAPTHGQGDEDLAMIDDIADASGKVEADWMFQTFDQQNKPASARGASKVSNSKRHADEEQTSSQKQMLGLDPFMNLNEVDDEAD